MTKHDDELKRILEAERLDPDGPEMREIQRCRAEVEKIICNKFGSGALSIRYGGSKAKGTMLKVAYDLDILAYFHRNNGAAGETLPAIYRSMTELLGQHYRIDPGTTAIRLHAKDDKTKGPGLRIDVVPGRFIDESKTKVFLHQQDGDKNRLMTDPDEHIKFVRESGVLDGVCVLKLWRVNHAIQIRQFPFEILSVDLLKPNKHLGLADQVAKAFGAIAGMDAPPTVKDPANSDNDLSRILSPSVWVDLRAAAAQSLDSLRWQGWSGVLMVEPVVGGEAEVAAAVKTVHVATKPWSI